MANKRRARGVRPNGGGNDVADIFGNIARVLSDENAMVMSTENVCACIGLVDALRSYHCYGE